jgi:hypothetical protein
VALIHRLVPALLLAAGAALAQGRTPALDVVLPASELRATDGPSVRGLHLLADSKTRELLHAGFPVALHFRLELWRQGGWPNFNERESRTEWHMLVEHDPVRRTYRVRRQAGGQLEDLGTLATLAEADAAVSRPYRPVLGPRRPGDRYYYNATVEVTTLTGSDLDALQRWLRGEVQPAVQGRSNPAGALQRGLGTLMSRMLGGATRQYQRRSAMFTAAG